MIGPDLTGDDFSETLLTPDPTQTPQRGRPREVGDEQLLRALREIEFVIDQSWGNIGWALSNADSITNIQSAFSSIAQFSYSWLDSYRERGTEQATAASLRSLRKDCDNASKQIAQTEHRTGADAFRDFFEFDDHRELFPNVDGKIFYTSIRNGLLHQAQTKLGWRIRSGRPSLWDSDKKIIDRTKFANALDKAFANYVRNLESANWDDDIWLKARRKIWWLIQLSQ